MNRGHGTLEGWLPFMSMALNIMEDRPLEKCPNAGGQVEKAKRVFQIMNEIGSSC